MISFTSVIVGVGKHALDFLAEDMLVLFYDDVPSDLADYSVSIKKSNLYGEIEQTDIMELDGISYEITAVGDYASNNFKTLGHVTLKFDGADKAHMPGYLHLAGKTPGKISIGSKLTIEKR